MHFCFFFAVHSISSHQNVHKYVTNFSTMWHLHICIIHTTPKLDAWYRNIILLILLLPLLPLLSLLRLSVFFRLLRLLLLLHPVINLLLFSSSSYNRSKKKTACFRWKREKQWMKKNCLLLFTHFRFPLFHFLPVSFFVFPFVLVFEKWKKFFFLRTIFPWECKERKKQKERVKNWIIWPFFFFSSSSFGVQKKIRS